MRNSLIIRSPKQIAMLVLVALCPAALLAAENWQENIKHDRAIYGTERKAVVAEAMQLTQTESAAFWPLYSQYRAQQEKLGDELIKLVLQYADLYPDVPEKQASQMTKSYSALENDLVKSRTSYLKKFAKVLPPSKVLRFAQLENRLDLGLRLQMASIIPLLPIEGQLTGQARGLAMLTEGVPGGAAVQTYEINATVTAIDKPARRITLLSPDGIKQTVKIGPEAINFNQIRLGDKLNLTVTEGLIVYVAGEGEPADNVQAKLVELAPKGAKPGGLLAETTQVAAKITALDLGQRKATLQFEDGTTRTVGVRPDVDLASRKVGDKVIIRLTEAVAINVNKP